MIESYTSKVVHKQKISINWSLAFRCLVVAAASLIIYSSIFAVILFNTLYHNL